MTKLYLFTTFHGNLGYSSISVDRYPEVIEKVYWPFLRMVEELGIKLGFEFPGKTLEIINKLDPGLLAKIKQLQEKGLIELIGSGYTQNIFPLIPAKVNEKCLELGNKVYVQLLGQQPKIALANEQVYSKGLLALYLDAGYKALIIDWINAYATNKKLKDAKYNCPFIKGADGETIRVLWNNFKCFQKMQRYVYGDVNFNEYISFVMDNYSSEENRVLNVYGNDMEVFDFRPRCATTLHSGDVKFPEIQKIKNAFRVLMEKPEIEFVLPSDAIKKLASEEIFDVGSSGYPIITKKQEKYNVTRWAVCGKNNYISNTLCYKAYKLLLQGGTEDQWTRLVEYWASDNRTHTDPARYDAFRNGVKELIKELNDKEEIIPEKFSALEVPIEDSIIETQAIKIEFNPKKGGTIKSLIFKEVSRTPLISTIPPEHFDDVKYTVDLFSGNTIMFISGNQKTDLSDTKLKASDKGLYVKVVCENEILEGVIINKEYRVYKNQPKVDLIIKIDAKQKIKPDYIRTGIITIHPKAFNKNELYYKTHNGGALEKYPLVELVDQTDTVEMRVSSKQCLGSTEGMIEIGDKKKKLIITTDKSELYSIPLLKFEQVEEDYVLRIFNSIIEKDATSSTYMEGINKITFSFQAENV